MQNPAGRYKDRTSCYLHSLPDGSNAANALSTPVCAHVPLAKVVMNLQLGFYSLLALLVGALGGIHVPINAALGVRINSALVATLTFYGIAFLMVAAACLLLWDRAAFAGLKTVPRWYFIAGAISAPSWAAAPISFPASGHSTCSCWPFRAKCSCGW